MTDSQHETESNGSSDHTGIPDENKLFETKFPFEAKYEYKKINQSKCTADSSNHDNQEFWNEKMRWPLELSVTEEGEA